MEPRNFQRDIKVEIKTEIKAEIKSEEESDKEDDDLSGWKDILNDRDIVPPDFVLDAPSQELFLEDIDDDDDVELFFIQAPIDLDMEKLESQEISLNGMTVLPSVGAPGKFKTRAVRYENSELTNLYHLIVPKKSNNELSIVQKKFSGHITVMREYDPAVLIKKEPNGNICVKSEPVETEPVVATSSSMSQLLHSIPEFAAWPSNVRIKEEKMSPKKGVRAEDRPTSVSKRVKKEPLSNDTSVAASSLQGSEDDGVSDAETVVAHDEFSQCGPSSIITPVKVEQGVTNSPPQVFVPLELPVTTTIKQEKLSPKKEPPFHL